MNRDLPELGIEFEKMDRFNWEAATGGALQKKVFVKKSQNSQKNTFVGVPFISKKDSDTGVFLSIFGNS